MREFLINQNDAGQRLDKWLTKALPALPQSLMHKYIRLKRIKCNGKRCELNYKLQPGDTLQLYINDEFFEKPDPDSAWRSLTPRLEIVYEDDQILLADKKPGMVVHEDESGDADTLINHIKAYLFQKGEWDPDKENTFAPSLCNRIDRNTGGIVIAAKTAEALRILNDKIKERELDKQYLCLVHGTPRPAEGVLENFLKRDLQEKRVFITKTRVPGALTAKTGYKVLESRGGLSLVECTLFTGRTHQIRAQMAHFGHPLAGDTKYGTAKQNQGLPFFGQALYAYKLTFRFKNEAGVLQYLNGRSFRVEGVPFLEYFRKLPKGGK